MKLTADQITWTTHGHKLLHNISFTVASGMKFGLIGPNGSGKTTLLRILAGLRKPQNGQILLNGHCMAKMQQRDIARSIALVEQLADTTDRITVQQAVALGRTPFLSPLSPWSENDETIVSQALHDVDIWQMRDRLWHTLSGGERQRVHIARALAQQPKILLLDEPTNHLDIGHQLSILQLIKQFPITVIIVLHDLQQAMECEQIAMLDKGHVVEMGTPNQVMTKEHLCRIFGVYSDVIDDPIDGSRILRFRRAM